MSFQVAHVESQSVPPIDERLVAEEESFQRGALLVENDYGEFQEVESGVYMENPTHVALARFGVEGEVPFEGTPPFDILGGKGFPPGKMQATVIRHGNRQRRYSALYVGTLPTSIGGEYGVVRDTDGRWKVDFDGTGVVKLESLQWAQDPINKNRVVVSFLAASEE